MQQMSPDVEVSSFLIDEKLSFRNQTGLKQTQTLHLNLKLSVNYNRLSKHGHVWSFQSDELTAISAFLMWRLRRSFNGVKERVRRPQLNGEKIDVESRVGREERWQNNVGYTVITESVKGELWL